MNMFFQSIIVEDIKNAFWNDANKKSIIVEIKFAHTNDFIPVVISEEYDIPYGVELFKMLKNKELIPINDFSGDNNG